MVEQARSVQEPVVEAAPVEVAIRSVPEDYHLVLKLLRRRLGWSQADLARQIGAAGKAVVYQWESRKRTPSLVFRSRTERLL